MFQHEKNRKRAQALVEQMTLDEKISQLTYNSAGIPRLGIPAYNWWNEALHGVARAGTATSFPQAIGLAAIFDEAFIAKIAKVIADEGRAKYNESSKHDDRDIYKGLTFWSPNINIFRDPRWGRGHETYGEDPYLSSRLGVAFIKGLQGEGNVMHAAACAKHFAVHSGPEDLRHEFDAVSTPKDLWETYLPAFEACVREANVESVMGAYNRVNGEPACGSYFLLRDILRDRWDFKGHVVSDCWAIKDFHMFHKVTKSPKESAALAMDAGCDLNCGNIYIYMLQAYEAGLVNEEQITEAVTRLFTTRYKLGLFDSTEYDQIPYESIESKEHTDLAIEAARKSVVLLKNDNVLPLNKKELKTIGVIGPNANSRLALKANYYGTSSRYITLLEGIQDEVGDDVRVLYSKGCELWQDRTEPLATANDRLSEAMTVAEHSDVLVLCLGLDERLEGEEMDEGNHVGSGDKTDLELPVVQKRLLEKIVSLGKPVILCLIAGSAINLSYAEDNCQAILQAWYPGARGGKAVADILFGLTSPSGKLPITFYRTLEGMPEFTDYSMENRTYRYYEGEPLYSFGYGLTYGDVRCQDVHIEEIKAADSVRINVKVKNIGKVPTDDVIQCYVKDEESEFAVKNVSLAGFKRVYLKPNESKHMTIEIPWAAFTVVDSHGERYIDSHSFTIYIGTFLPDQRSRKLMGYEPLSIKLHQ